MSNIRSCAVKIALKQECKRLKPEEEPSFSIFRLPFVYFVCIFCKESASDLNSHKPSSTSQLASFFPHKNYY